MRAVAFSVHGPAPEASPTTEIRGEPIAYLLDNREANDDPENFWVFSQHAYFPWRREPVGGRSAGVSVGLPDGLQSGGGRSR